MLLFFQMDPLLSPSFPPCYMSPFLSIVSSLHIHHTILLMFKLCRNKIYDVFRSPCTQHEVSTACPGPAVPFCIFVFAFHYAWLFLLGDFGYKIWRRHIPCLLTAQRGAGDGLVFVLCQDSPRCPLAEPSELLLVRLSCCCFSRHAWLFSLLLLQPHLQNSATSSLTTVLFLSF